MIEGGLEIVEFSRRQPDLRHDRNLPPASYRPDDLCNNLHSVLRLERKPRGLTKQLLQRRDGPRVLAEPGLGFAILVLKWIQVECGREAPQIVANVQEADVLQMVVTGSITAVSDKRESEYRDHREKAIAAQVLVVTHAAAFIDSFSPGYAGLRILAQSAVLRVQAAM